MAQKAQKAVEKKPYDERAKFFTGAFSSFSVNDVKKAKDFYSQKLGVDVSDEEEGGLALNLDRGQQIFIYPKQDHKPATFTVLNFQVAEIERAVDDLTNRGVRFESFEGDIKTDKKGIHWGEQRGGGPNIAWFKDPAGNFISVIEQK
jgi:predicted enzyme related to lactoylglutathione lyase